MISYSAKPDIILLPEQNMPEKCKFMLCSLLTVFILRLRKNLTLTSYIWNPQYADPTSADFAQEKQTREDQVSL
jgi:hypothetical protein